MPDPRYFRIRAKRLGGHVHTTWWSARRRDGSYAGLGSLVMDEHDWAALSDILNAAFLTTVVSDPVPEDDPASGRGVGRAGEPVPFWLQECMGCTMPKGQCECNS